METASVPAGAKLGLGRRATMPAKDVWAAARNGTPHDVDAALILLRRNNGNIDARNIFGSTALHIAVWRNHVPIVKRLLAAGADPDVRDGESGWSSLHRALHFGHLAVAGVLIEAGSSLLLEDSKGRTPIDLLSGPVNQVVSDSNNSGGTEVFSWGNGANYQLGTGTAGIQKVPCRIDALQGLDVIATAAAKFHSVAVTADGKLYSWGFGRGGRLGHSDFDIHSGQVAVITPQLVSCGLGSRRVKVIAVAKHHTVVATEGGEVFTWGSNREGQLGYTSVDTQPTPRRVSSLKARVVAVAAANKHSVVLTEIGDIFTWGCNREGQLGYGTSNSASNYIPRAVEYLKGKKFLAVSAAKYHTIALGVEGEVFTWGYKMVMPRRVLIARNTRKGGSVPLKFHRAERLHIVTVAAGTTHSTALSEDGLIFYWVSADPHLRCHQLLSMAGHQAVAVAAGKYRTAVVTAIGNVFTWDGEKTKINMPPVPFRIHGAKHAIHVSVGENHSLVIAAVYIPKFPPQSANETSPVGDVLSRDVEECEEDLDMDEMALERDLKSKHCSEIERQPCVVPSLKELCQRVMAQFVVEPKNALQLLEVADSLGAYELRKHCEDLVLHNLDYLLMISPMTFAHVAPALLAEVEKALDASSAQPWSHRHLPTPTATFPAVLDSEEDDNEAGYVSRMRALSFAETNNSIADVKRASEGFFRQESEVDEAVMKQLRALRKKLQQIEALELKRARGHSLDDQQLAKLQTKQALEDAILALDSGAAPGARVEAWKSEHFSEESLPGKTGGSRSSHSARKKKKKVLEEQTMIEELHNRKSKNGRINKAINKKGQNVSEDQSKESTNEVASPIIEEKVQLLEEHQTSATKDVWKSDFAAVPEKSGFTVESSKPNSKAGIHGFVAGPSETSMQNFPLQDAEQPAKRKNKKGGLSMFLSGALDDVPKVVPVQAPVSPKVEGPAWGGVQMNKGLASLREIQNQQTAESSNASAEDSTHAKFHSKSVKGKQLVGDRIKGSRTQGDVPESVFDDADASGFRIPLCQLVRSSAPIAVTPVKATKVASGANPDSSPTPWAGTSPLTSASSFKEIQMQQVKHKTHQRHGGSQGSPKPCSPIGSLNISTTSNTILEHGMGEKITSRWFKPETDSPSSIRCIQIEEEAMKELRRFYKNVKLVRNEDV